MAVQTEILAFTLPLFHCTHIIFSHLHRVTKRAHSNKMQLTASQTVLLPAFSLSNDNVPDGLELADQNKSRKN